MITQNPYDRLASESLREIRPDADASFGPYLVVFATAAFVLLSGGAWGQEAPGSATFALARPQTDFTARKGEIRVDSTLVLIPVTVTDPMNRFVTGLDETNFKVIEDKTEQRISTFSSEDLPLSVGVVFDCSGSMGPKLE